MFLTYLGNSTFPVFRSDKDIELFDVLLFDPRPGKYELVYTTKTYSINIFYIYKWLFFFFFW